MASRGGFTLPELLVALAIAGILAAVALPSWREYVIRTRRTEGQGALQALMGQQERYFTQHNRYIAFGADAPEPEAQQFRWWSGTTAASSAYEIAGRACEGDTIDNCIELTATPGTSRVDSRFRDDTCQRLTLTSRGERRASATQDTAATVRCWR
ncbi:type IV pilus assembly protein PilE [Pseudoduganella lurida]|uniref:Type IV pilus assembly protein PilE n=2 Tax=Pseudoduganella lurida TaxID=1036180 RepID=A0A562RMD6_9BURK|nr:type IV pilus assembly protein PilE [Pseudoduganella lurida]